MDNPFKRVPGGKKPDAVGSGGVQISETVGELCVFVGNMAIPVMPSKQILEMGPAMPEIRFALHPCVKSRCMFWKGTDADGLCLIRAGMEALVSMAPKKSEGSP